jgi:hypothetical protein
MYGCGVFESATALLIQEPVVNLKWTLREFRRLIFGTLFWGAGKENATENDVEQWLE